ncbi:MAG: zeta toxin family protein [Elusimicrobia bacterium]|nr:zeta toxin family protein [Elusimicrobiota bacterium]
MTAVAGPSGSGKTIRFRVQDFGVDSFNVDERCRDLHGSYQSIPPEIRRFAQEECERFVQEHIRAGISFAVETTLGGGAVAAEQARRAKDAGFFTSVVYVATSDAELNVERVRQRGLAGGPSAEPDVIRKIYRQSLGNIAAALQVFDRAELYDNSGSDPRLVLRVANGRVVEASYPAPEWVRESLAGSPLAAQLEP